MAFLLIFLVVKKNFFFLRYNTGTMVMEENVPKLQRCILKGLGIKCHNHNVYNQLSDDQEKHTSSSQMHTHPFIKYRWQIPFWANPFWPSSWIWPFHLKVAIVVRSIENSLTQIKVKLLPEELEANSTMEINCDVYVYAWAHVHQGYPKVIWPPDSWKAWLQTERAT